MTNYILCSLLFFIQLCTLYCVQTTSFSEIHGSLLHAEEQCIAIYVCSYWPAVSDMKKVHSKWLNSGLWGLTPQWILKLTHQYQTGGGVWVSDCLECIWVWCELFCALHADEQCQSPPLSCLSHSRRQLGLHGTIYRPFVLGPRESHTACSWRRPSDIVFAATSTRRSWASGHAGAGVWLAAAGRLGWVQLLARCLCAAIFCWNVPSMRGICVDNISLFCSLKAVLWHCWLAVGNSIRLVKIEWVICLQRDADYLHMVQLMPLPSSNPIISCLI